MQSEVCSYICGYVRIRFCKKIELIMDIVSSFQVQRSRHICLKGTFELFANNQSKITSLMPETGHLAITQHVSRICSTVSSTGPIRTFFWISFWIILQFIALKMNFKPDKHEFRILKQIF